jgi:phytoene/squalene synthetase
MMCGIFSIRDSDSLYAAKMLAYSMQCINFIRDIEEDNALGRRYLYDIVGIQYD